MKYKIVWREMDLILNTPISEGTLSPGLRRAIINVQRMVWGSMQAIYTPGFCSDASRGSGCCCTLERPAGAPGIYSGENWSKKRDDEFQRQKSRGISYSSRKTLVDDINWRNRLLHFPRPDCCMAAGTTVWGHPIWISNIEAWWDR